MKTHLKLLYAAGFVILGLIIGLVLTDVTLGVIYVLGGVLFAGYRQEQRDFLMGGAFVFAGGGLIVNVLFIDIASVELVRTGIYLVFILAVAGVYYVFYKDDVELVSD